MPFRAALVFTFDFLTVFIHMLVPAVGEILAKSILVELADGHFEKLFLKYLLLFGLAIHCCDMWTVQLVPLDVCVDVDVVLYFTLLKSWSGSFRLWQFYLIETIFFNVISM